METNVNAPDGADQSAPSIQALSALLEAAQRQAQAARDGDWSEVVRIVTEREELLARLRGALEGREPAGSERDALVSLGAQVQALDGEVIDRAADEAQRLSAEIEATRRGQGIASAYHRATLAAHADLVNRRG